MRFGPPERERDLVGFNTFLKGGKFYAQRFRSTLPVLDNGCRQGAFFHMQEWKKIWGYGTHGVDPLELVRMCATARIMLPKSMVRLSAGRTRLNREAQLLCFMAGANSIFYGEKLLTMSEARLSELGKKPDGGSVAGGSPNSSARRSSR